jgi:hypothetical protein
MIIAHNYLGTCWWCGGIADSAEHKHKRTDLRREFGDGPYLGDSEIVRNVKERSTTIQGPKSKEVKFIKNLCQKCNNQRSQAFDRDYDKFTSFIKDNEEAILRKKSFNFSDIYNNDWEFARINLIRYYIKHIGCRLASANILISQDIVNFLDGRQGQTLKHIGFYLEIRSDIANMINALQSSQLGDGCLWIGDLMCSRDTSGSALSDAASFIGYRWLRMNYLYDYRIGNSFDNFSKNKVVLPIGSNAPDFTNIRPES